MEVNIFDVNFFGVVFIGVKFYLMIIDNVKMNGILIGLCEDNCSLGVLYFV